MVTVRLPQSELEMHLGARPKHVFISGASRGIGEAIARRLAEGTHRFSLAARSHDALLSLARDLGPDRAQALPLDLAKDRSIDAAIVAAESRFGPIDILICNAGTNAATPLSDLSAENRARFREIIDVNLTGTVFLAQLACAHMPPGGRVVFIGSVLGRFGAPGSIAYVASKHAIQGVVRTMALEWAHRGIRVNALNPGWVDTDMARASMQSIADKRGVSLEKVLQQQMDAQPVRRMIKPEEIAAYVEFLVGPTGDVWTGLGIDISAGSVMV